MSQQTRREFLENSMFAAAAAAAAGTVAQQAMAAEAQSTSPNERLRVAIIGVRGRGGAHISDCMKRKDVEIAVICDADSAVGEQRCESIGKSTGKKPQFVQDVRKAMEDDSIDFVSIATPNHWHALNAIWAIQAGKDVYVEKPVSHNVSEGRRIVDFARKHNKIVQTGTQCRSMGGTIEAIEYIQAGKIGDVTIARGLCYKPRGSIGARGKYDVPSTVDFNLWTGPAAMEPLERPKLHYDWHWDWNTGNGDLGNQGIHQMDIARWGLGVEGLGKTVQSYGGRLGYEDAGETANTQVSVHDYGDKQLVFEVRGLKTGDLRGAKVGVIFYGSEGYVVLNSYNGGAAFDLKGNVVKKFSAGGDHYDNFISAVRSRKAEDLAADIEEGHLSSALCHLGNISYLLGEKFPVTEAKPRVAIGQDGEETFDRVASHLKDNGLDLAKTQLVVGPRLTLSGEEFTGTLAEKANPMLTREYRKGFEVPAKA